ncbi:MAG: SMC-Scp complex subunit ScpB [Haliscomenobacter sp.]|nr:SMC-Scp complex subunit ScpB [Haliscomenobacter sp.]
MEYLAQHIESLIFASDSPIPVGEIQACLEETFGLAFHAEEIESAIRHLKEKYQNPEHAFEVVEIAEGFQFLTKGAYHGTVSTMLKQKNKRRLSQAALETLSIIAYKQPVSKSDLEKIRGVNCDYAIQKLLEKELVTITGRSEGPGRPLLYGTSEKFMDYFGLRSLKDLPQPKDFKEPDQMIGEQESIEENLNL